MSKKTANWVMGIVTAFALAGMFYFGRLNFIHITGCV